MKIRISISALLLGLAATLGSCENEKAAQEKLQKEVLEQHDSIMTKMDLLNEEQMQLDLIRNNFKNMNDVDTLALGLSIDSAKSELQNADDAMMEWMHNFNPDYTGMSHQQIIDYLNQQHKSIDSVKVLFDHALSKSKSFTSKYQ